MPVTDSALASPYDHLAMGNAAVVVLLSLLTVGCEGLSAQLTSTEKPSEVQPHRICSLRHQDDVQSCRFDCNDPDRPKTESCIGRPHPTFTPDPEYTDDARRSGVQGSVLLGIVVDETGSVSEATVERSLHPGLDGNSLDTVKRWKFDPATIDGKPVPVRLEVSMSFRLKYAPPHRRITRRP